MERRGLPRVSTHIAMEMAVADLREKYYGYIENLGENGAGIALLECLIPGTQVALKFMLPGSEEKIRPIGTAVYAYRGYDNIGYHGICFKNLRENEWYELRRYLASQKSSFGTTF